MNFEADDLLDRVDQWKFKLHEDLKNLTAHERAEFWRQARKKARARGLTVPEPEQAASPPRKRRRRATG